MIGVEVRAADGSPMPGAAVAEAALRRDLLVLTCGTSGSVIRIVPPLTIPEEDLEAGLDRLEAAFREVLG